MSCCGKSRVQPFVLRDHRTTQTEPPVQQSGPIAPKSSRPTPGGTTFQYIGKTRLTVIGPVTRQRYDFDRSGARLSVDPRDANSLATVATLKRV